MNNNKTRIQIKIPSGIEESLPSYASEWLRDSLEILESNNSLRFSFCAMGLRELLRIALDSEAPEEEILKCHWWTPTYNKGKCKCDICNTTIKTKTLCGGNGITRKDRIKYIIHGGFTDFDASWINECESLAAEYASLVNQLSDIAHSLENTHIFQQDKYIAGVENALALLNDIFHKALSAREEIWGRIESTLKTELNSRFFESCFSEIDSLSTHSTFDELSDYNLKIDRIDAKTIYFSGTGVVNYDLIYGSESDRREDINDGFGEYQNIKSFPFSYKGTTATNSLAQMKIESIEINESIPDNEDEY